MDTSDKTGYTDLVALVRELRYAVRPDPASPATAYSYLRYSTLAQTEGDSVRRQTALRDAWLKRHPGVALDTSLTLVDAGVSGYTGKHRTDRRHALACFVDQVERGRVVPGSYLIVENLDRLTREQPVDSIPAVLSLIKLGVRVVQLAPTEVVYTADMDQGALMLMLWELSRGHAESKRKSGLCGEAWGEKKAQARAVKAPHGKAVPAWLELTPDGYRVKEEAGRAVRLIYEWSAQGLGTLRIASRLNAETVPPIARGTRWIRSYVAKILANRAVLGEYQPMKGDHDRTPDGEPVPDYFPRVISDDLWYAAHGAAQARNKRSGRPGKKGTGSYVFQGLLRCALDRCPLHVVTRKGQRLLLSAECAQGVAGSHWRPYPLETFVAAVLGRLVELRAADLFADPAGARVSELTGRLAEVEKRLAVALARFEADPESPVWADRVSAYDREKRSVVKELAGARQEAANPLSEAWAEAVELMRRDDPERLRQALLATVEEVSCLVVVRGRQRLCAAQVRFRAAGAGAACRDYLIVHPGGACLSVPHPAGGAPLDLRDPGHVRDLEAALERLDLSGLTG